jgi:multiple sugar transport system permease protein
MRELLARMSPGYVFVLPAVLLIILFAVYPMFYVARMSLTRIVRTTGESYGVGIQNYLDMFATPLFVKAVRQTVVFASFSSLGHVVLGLILALGLNANLNRRFLTICRTAILLPWALSPIVVAIIAQLWAYPLISPIAKILKAAGSTAEFLPLGRPGSALWTIVGINIWQFTPFFILMILAGLQTLDPELPEAAKVDGASPLRIIRHVTIPHLRRVLMTLALFDFVTTAAYFDLIWVTTQGGPVRGTEVLATYTYRLAFLNMDWNRAATSGMVLLLVSTTIALLITFYMERD